MLQVTEYQAPGMEYRTVRRRGGKAGKRKGAAAESGRVHLVIKNKCFDVTLSTVGAAVQGARGARGAGAEIDFRRSRVLASLEYAGEGTAFVQDSRVPGEPLVFDVTPAKDGTSASVELRIAPLSSQHQGALFSVRFAVEHEGEARETVSEPFRVVSKKSQIEKGKPKRARTTQSATREAVLDMLGKMDAQQEEHKALMDRAYAQNAQQQRVMERLMDPSLAEALQVFLTAYRRIPNAAKRATKLAELAGTVAEVDRLDMQECASVFNFSDDMVAMGLDDLPSLFALDVRGPACGSGALDDVDVQDWMQGLM